MTKARSRMAQLLCGITLAASAARAGKALHHIDPSGRRVGSDPVIWFASDSVQGPRFAPQGSI